MRARTGFQSCAQCSRIRDSRSRPSSAKFSTTDVISSGETSIRAAPSFHQKPLPETVVPFDSTEGRKMFRESLHSGHLESFFPLSQQFITQNEPAFCGLGSLAMVLNALKIDPGRTWKGNWRWFTEETLLLCRKEGHDLTHIKKNGICIQGFRQIASVNGAQAPVYRPHRESVFRRRVAAAAASPHKGYMVVNYWRPALSQTGTGHFSPVAGYHPESDSALILDVARFKYAPYWVPLPRLFKAMRPNGPNNQPRGYSVVKAERLASSRQKEDQGCQAPCSQGRWCKRIAESTRLTMVHGVDGAGTQRSCRMNSAGEFPIK